MDNFNPETIAFAKTALLIIGAYLFVKIARKLILGNTNDNYNEHCEEMIKQAGYYQENTNDDLAQKEGQHKQSPMLKKNDISIHSENSLKIKEELYNIATNLEEKMNQGLIKQDLEDDDDDLRELKNVIYCIKEPLTIQEKKKSLQKEFLPEIKKIDELISEKIEYISKNTTNKNVLTPLEEFYTDNKVVRVLSNEFENFEFFGEIIFESDDKLLARNGIYRGSVREFRKFCIEKELDKNNCELSEEVTIRLKQLKRLRAFKKSLKFDLEYELDILRDEFIRREKWEDMVSSCLIEENITKKESEEFQNTGKVKRFEMIMKENQSSASKWKK